MSRDNDEVITRPLKSESLGTGIIREADSRHKSSVCGVVNEDKIKHFDKRSDKMKGKAKRTWWPAR